METAVLMEIEKLRRASLSALREKYREVFGEATECWHRQHLFRRIAWRLQALAEGDLSERARQRAGEIARDADLRPVSAKFHKMESLPQWRRRPVACWPLTARATCSSRASSASARSRRMGSSPPWQATAR